jgi:hypothetical protein
MCYTMILLSYSDVVDELMGGGPVRYLFQIDLRKLLVELSWEPLGAEEEVDSSDAEL